MKRFLISIVGIIILLPGCNHTNTHQTQSTQHSDPPPTIIIRNKETLENILLSIIMTRDDRLSNDFMEYVFLPECLLFHLI